RIATACFRQAQPPAPTKTEVAMPKLRSYLVAFLLAPLFWIGAAQASTIFLKARLDGAQAGVVSSGDGSAFLTYDTATQLLTWTVNYRGLSSAANAAHIH